MLHCFWLWSSINQGKTNFRDSQLLFLEYAATLIPQLAFIIRLQFIKSTCTLQAEIGPGCQLSTGSDCSSHTCIYPLYVFFIFIFLHEESLVSSDVNSKSPSKLAAASQNIFKIPKISVQFTGNL